MNNIRIVFGVLTLTMLTFTSCLKKNFDAPADQTGYDPNLKVTKTLAQIKALVPNSTGNATGYKQITDDAIIYGIVTADDRSGNFYKQIVLEDSTSGMTVLLDAYSLYNDYPIGRKIYINCKGLYLGFYNGLPQLGYTPDNTGAITGIPSVLIPNYITKANYPNTVTPKTVTLADLTTFNNALVNRLVKIEGLEFQNAFLSNPYAAPAPSSGTSTTLEDCSKSTIILRTSGFANFQPYIVPSGKGSVTAIYTVYKGTAQLVIRDTNDVKLYDLRCDGTVGPGPKPIISIDSVRKMFKGTGIKLPDAKIKGIVISDKGFGNVGTGSVIIQDGDRGMSIYAGSANYNLGDSLVIDVTGDSLIDYKGSLEIKASSAQITLAGSAKTITPKQLTIAQLNSSYTSGYSIYEFTLVKILNATASGGSTFGSNANRTLTDATGNMILFTGSGATFKNDPLPTVAKTYTGILNRYLSTVELQLRNPATDVQ